ncbi:DUF2092 domain-containing protein [Pseudomonas sp. NFX224]|uniref:DUF2092 domain-containing protein n=1 Tax=Pseudomonas sp. NFX224 TaxID=3402862 RepID=UPI003AFABDCF
MKVHMSIVGLLFTLAVIPVARAEDPPAADNTPLINPQVVDKVIDMGNHLRSLEKFQVDAEVSRDSVLESGQKIKTESSNVLKVVGHDRLYAKTEGDVRTREFFYNGKKLTQYSPFLKYYTTVDAPPKVSETLHRIEDYYGVQVPLEDLFLFGSDQAQIDALKEALYVGPSTINGKLCDHLAFRQQGIDWQLWITRAEKPLPCKLVITTTDEASFPEYTAVYRWNLKPDIKDSIFTFKPGKGDVSIPLKKASDKGGE